MKTIDKILRYWRVKVALREAPKEMNAIFDIGCDDGYLLMHLNLEGVRLDGCDPRLTISSINPDSHLTKGNFPSAIEKSAAWGTYDAIFALAVFEHFSEADLQKSASVIAKMLSSSGRLIVTVPHPLVDRILGLLLFLRLIDGQALEEHHGFNPESLMKCLSMTLRITRNEKFQFGLNNVFVFERSYPS